MNDLTLQPTESSQKLDLSTITVFGEHTETAAEILTENMNRLSEQEAVCKVLRLFIAKHGDTLAGMYWSTAYCDSEIRISPNYYRCQKVTANDIASKWPGAKWERVECIFTKPLKRDWIAKVDGVTLRIEAAENYEKIHIPANGVIKL